MLVVPLFPEAASTLAGKVDALFFFLCAVSIVFSLLIGGLVFYFAARYRRRSENERAHQIHGDNRLETIWSVIPFALAMVMFVWGVDVYFEYARPPRDAMDIYVVGKQWMWKFQHPEGHREINELHVPTGRAVRLTMTSEDVIHDLYIPAFRVKQDAVPGRYSTVWFEATKPGRYHLFCAEYCGTKHSQMIGSVVVMEPAEYQAWLAGDAPAMSLAAAGEKLFEELACVTCHREDTKARGPLLDDLFGKEVRLRDGSTVVADEKYLRDSILRPAAKIVAGYEPIMPTFEGQISEEGLLSLVSYIKSLGRPQAAAPAPAAGGKS
ncbi:MAG: cytochrome c oxidase subunit II [bacterium]